MRCSQPITFYEKDKLPKQCIQTMNQQNNDKEEKSNKTISKGAFMQADMDELDHVCFHGEMVNKLIEIDKEMYELFVVEEKGE